MSTIPLKALVGIIAPSYEAVKKKIYRNDLERMTVPNRTGHELHVSAEALIAKGWISPAEADRLAVAASSGLAAVANEGDKLIASDCVRKKYENLSPTETRVMDKLCPGWFGMPRMAILESLERVCQVKRSWLYREHRQNGRRKETMLSQMKDEQRYSIQTHFIKAKAKRTFVQRCLGDPSLPPVSERAWYRIYKELARTMRDEKILTTQGQIALRQISEPILRDKTYLKPLECIVGDYWRVDRVCRWIDGTLVRPALAVWIDWRTTKIVGTALARNPNALGVKTSLFQVFILAGRPWFALMDNGKEYTAFSIVGDEIEETRIRGSWMDEIDSEIKRLEHKGILKGMGVIDLNAIARNPRSKPVERVFGRGGFTDWAREFGDWTGRTYWERPEVLKKAIVKHKQGRPFVEKLTGQSIQFCDMYELAASINEFVEFHNNRPSKGFGMDGKSPNQLWNELTLEYPPERPSVYEIAFNFLEGETRKVRNTGHIEFKKDFFFRCDKLWHFRGETVHIRFNAVDGFWWVRGDKKQFEYLPKMLLVFDLDGGYIGQAEFIERSHPLEADVKKLMRGTQRTVREAKDTIREISGMPVVDVKTLPEEASRVVAEIEEKRTRREEEELQERLREFPEFD